MTEGSEEDFPADGRPEKIREYAQQIYREIYRSGFMDDEQELRAFCLDKAISMKSWSLTPKEEDPVDSILDVSKRFFNYVTHGDEHDDCLSIAAEAKAEARRFKKQYDDLLSQIGEAAKAPL